MVVQSAVKPSSVKTKGERTRAAILDEALKIVSKAGLDGLTIGTLADATGMSKSGLFAHFGSREELLLAVLAHGQAEFTEVVFQPAMAKPRGLPRLRAMFVNWLVWTESAELPGGCPMIGGAAAFDDKPGRRRAAHLDRDAEARRAPGGRRAAARRGHRPRADRLRDVRHRARRAPPPAPARLPQGPRARPDRARLAVPAPRRLLKRIQHAHHAPLAPN